MSDIVDSVIAATRELFAAKPYDSMSISDICKKAHVSRSAFYAHFEDKEELFRTIIQADFVDQLRTLRSALPASAAQKKNMGVDSRLLNEWTYHGFTDHREFYIKLNREEPALLQHALISSIQDLNQEVIEEYGLEPEEREYMTYFFAANHAMLIVKWIGDGMKLNPKKLATWYFDWSTHYWNDLASRVLLGKRPATQD